MISAYSLFLHYQQTSAVKTSISYILVFLISFAYNFDTIKLVSKVIGETSVVWVDDFDCEEKSEGNENSKEKNEKNEKSDFFDDFYLDNNLISGQIELLRIHSKQNHNFSSSDFSQVVYSPPELA